MSTIESPNSTRLLKEQYEQFPYPHREPVATEGKLTDVPLDDLDAVNFYCFGGKQDYLEGFRVLVVGGGTGDSTLFLAHQLRKTNAEIVHLDLSQTSIHVAQRRAKLIGLENIVWKQGSLLDLPNENIEAFDYISCCGVLHHLDNPREGLEAITSVLKEDGGMALMLYAKYGRTPVYPMQQLLGLLNQDEPDAKAKLENARLLLDCLPETNWLRRASDLFPAANDYNDAECYDLFLHSTDRAFGVAEIYELLQQTSMKLVEFTPAMRPLYDSKSAFRDPELFDEVRQLPLPLQHAASELFWGNILTHEFWVSRRSNSSANPHEPDMVPFFSTAAEKNGLVLSLSEWNSDEAWSVKIERGPGISFNVTLPFHPVTREFIRLIDGRRTMQEIIDTIANGFPPGSAVEKIGLLCARVFEIFRSHDFLLLRHKSVERICEL